MWPNKVWQVIDVYSKYSKSPFLNQTFADVNVFFVLRRRSSFFVGNLLIPSVTINLLGAFSFFIPCGSGEKISYTVTIFLAQTVNMMIILDQLPSGGESVPIMGQYQLAALCFMVACLFTVIRLEYLHADPQFAKCAKQNFILTKLTPILGPNILDKLDEGKLKDTSEEVIAESVHEDARNIELDEVQKVHVACETLNRVWAIISLVFLTFITFVYMINFL